MVFPSSFLTLTKWERARPEVHRQKTPFQAVSTEKEALQICRHGRDFLRPSKFSWLVLTAHNPSLARACDHRPWKNTVCEQEQVKAYMGMHLQSQYQERWSKRRSSPRSAWVTRQDPIKSSWTWKLTAETSFLSRQRRNPVDVKRAWARWQVLGQAMKPDLKTQANKDL